MRPSAELTAAKKYGSPDTAAPALSPLDASAIRVSAPHRPVSGSDTTPPMRLPVAASTRASDTSLPAPRWSHQATIAWPSLAAASAWLVPAPNPPTGGTPGSSPAWTTVAAVPYHAWR